MAIRWFIQDSKQLSAEEREKAYDLLVSTPGLSYAVETRTNRQIDEMNILQVMALSRRYKTLILSLSLCAVSVPGLLNISILSHSYRYLSVYLCVHS